MVDNYNICKNTCWKSAEHITEHKQRQGYSPKQCFLEEDAHIFRVPTWEDVTNLYFSRLIIDLEKNQSKSFQKKKGTKC
tara:strand:- start:234 stop:470 length:237 start_codon:yes stop_codon:yes gene_type:complete